MADMCRLAHADLAGEAGEEPARAAVARAQAGWQAVADGGRPVEAQWKAMRGMLGGVLPPWRAARPQAGDRERERAMAVARRVRGMQTRAMRRVQAHKRRGARGAAWVAERERSRPLLQLVVAAWADCVKQGRAHQPWHITPPTASEWTDFRKRESAKRARRRRLGEAVGRLAAYGRLVHARHRLERRWQDRRRAFLSYADRRRAAQQRWAFVRAAVGRMRASVSVTSARGRRGSTAFGRLPSMHVPREGPQAGRGASGSPTQGTGGAKAGGTGALAACSGHGARRPRAAP